MTDTTQTDWPDRPLTDAQRANRASAELIPFGAHGLNPTSLAGVFDMAKHMATARGMVGGHLIGNPGACLAIIDVASQFQMSAFMVAKHTYFVDNMIAFDGQFVMAAINKFCPLEKPLRYEYSGELLPSEKNGVTRSGADKFRNPSTRKLRVIGRLKGDSEDRIYDSPAIKDIRIQNSPLWHEDPDLQLKYFASRRWQRSHWPEGLLGLPSPDLGDEDMQHHIGADNAKEINPVGGTALIDRLKGAQQQQGEVLVEQGDAAGFNEANIHTELDQVQQNGKDADKPKDKGKDKPAPEAKVEVASGLGDQPPAEAKLQELPKPKNVKQWLAYCERWIHIGDGDLMARWNKERKMRNDLGVVEEDRDPLFEKLTERIAEIEGRD